MDAVFTLGYDVLDLVDPDLAGVAGFQRSPRPKTHVVHREDYGAEEWQVLIIKRAVDEDVLVKACWRSFN